MGESGHELAERYDRSRDTTGFGGPEPVQVRRDVTISVRFSEQEIEQLRRHAEEAGMRVTAFIRAAALQAERPVDRDEVARLAADIEQQAHRLRRSAGEGLS